MENTNTRKNSGSPGYLKGMPIKTGVQIVPDDVKKLPYINEKINGFQLLSGDNQGKCYSVKESISGIKNTMTSDFLMNDFTDSKYFEDPTLSFEDSIITGCHLDLDFNQLKDFCTAKKFQNLVIF